MEETKTINKLKLTLSHRETTPFCVCVCVCVLETGGGGGGGLKLETGEGQYEFAYACICMCVRCVCVSACVYAVCVCVAYTCICMCGRCVCMSARVCAVCMCVCAVVHACVWMYTSVFVKEAPSWMNERSKGLNTQAHINSAHTHSSKYMHQRTCMCALARAHTQTHTHLCLEKLCALMLLWIPSLLHFVTGLAQVRRLPLHDVVLRDPHAAAGRVASMWCGRSSGAQRLNRPVAEQPRALVGFASLWISFDSASQKRGVWLAKGPNVRRSMLALAYAHPPSFSHFDVSLCPTFFNNLLNVTLSGCSTHFDANVWGLLEGSERLTL